jgi:hypothetical protein
MITNGSNVLKRSLTFAHFLIWSATKRSDWRLFAIGIKPPIKISFSYHEWSGEFWWMEICLCKPKFYSCIPWDAQAAYSWEFQADLSFLDDDVPF